MGLGGKSAGPGVARKEGDVWREGRKRNRDMGSLDPADRGGLNGDVNGEDLKSKRRKMEEEPLLILKVELEQIPTLKYRKI